MVVEAIVFSTEAQSLVPFHTHLFPVFEPVDFSSGLHEELHLHLFEFAHTEDELTGNDLVAESLTDLGDTKRNFHAARFLHVEVVDKNSLCCFGTEVDVA